MATIADLVAAGRTLLKTPWHSHARLPGVGIDCIGVPIVASWISGAKPRSFDIQGYSITPDGSMLGLCEQHMTQVPRGEMRPADVVVLRWGPEPHHVGLVGDWRHGNGVLSLIHAENGYHHKVIEHRLWFGGSMQFVAAYRIPGVEP